MAEVQYFPSGTLKKNLPPGIDDQFLPPVVVAQILGVSPKWLASAREGRKEITGPPFVKMGGGRTAPIRYRLSSLLAWMDSFPEITSTVRRSPVPLSHFGEFLEGANKEDRWLFAVVNDGTSATEIFTAITQNLFGSKFNYRWLGLEEYVSRRFITRRVNLDADTLRHLLEAGDGNISTGLAKILNCRSLDSI